eukprot:12908112-Alexandrium_andersonii.AAC.1
MHPTGHKFAQKSLRVDFAKGATDVGAVKRHAMPGGDGAIFGTSLHPAAPEAQRLWSGAVR